MSPNRSGSPGEPARPCLALGLVLWVLGVPVAGLAQAPATATAPSITSLEPDRETLRAAYGAQVAAANAGAAKVLDPADAARVQIELQDLQKLGCRPIEREGVHYDCRVEVRIRLPDQRPQTSVLNLWLERTEGGWVSR